LYTKTCGEARQSKTMKAAVTVARPRADLQFLPARCYA